MTDIQFASIKDAVRWAEEMATIPDMGSWLGSLLSKTSSGNMTRQEAIDIALTISTITQNCKPYKGLALKAVYSGRDPLRDSTLSIVLASRMARKPTGKSKDHRQLVALGLSTIRARQSLDLYGERYPVSRMAKDTGVSRETFTRSVGWPALRKLAADQLTAWIDQGESEISIELNQRGWLA